MGELTITGCVCVCEQAKTAVGLSRIFYAFISCSAFHLLAATAMIAVIGLPEQNGYLTWAFCSMPL